MAKKGIHRSVQTEIKLGQHLSSGTELRKGGVPWNKGLRFCKWRIKDYTLPELTKEQKAYLAGIFDGEGWVTYRVDWKPTNNTRVVFGIGQKDENLLRTIQSWLGIDNCLTQDKHNYWALQLTAKNQVAQVLKAIIPYLILKKEKAEKALEFIEADLRLITKVGIVRKKKIRAN